MSGMKKITVCRGDDGFGSQLLSMIGGLAVARKNNWKFLYTPINNIKLVNHPDFQNDDIERCGELLSGVMENLKIDKATPADGCHVYPHFHALLAQGGAHQFYTKEFLSSLQDSYPLPTPYSADDMNIAIHIRRGADINDRDRAARWIESSTYNNIIVKLLAQYPGALIHVFSWGESGVSVDSDRVIKRPTDKPGLLVDDFNALVHSDLLIVGSSSFSLTAGLFNKNVVICSKELMHLDGTVYPHHWETSYNQILGQAPGSLL